MNLKIEPITPRNRADVLALSVAPGQRGFIEPTAQCLLEAERLSLWRPVGIYDGDLPVGFAMYGLFPDEGEDGRVWLDRLLIDRRYQGRHYGEGALLLLLERLSAEYGRATVYLSLYPDNHLARKLYLRHGFAFNGESDEHGELVMVKRL